MKTRHFLFTSISFLCALCAQAAPTVELAARESADNWLKIVDKGEYGEAWAQCAPFFRVQIAKEEFVKALTLVRPPLGAVESRELVRLFYTTTLPNAPDAHYVVIQYKTKFTGRTEPAFELVTPMLINSKGEPVSVVDDPLTTPGEWQISGYYIQ